MPGYHLCPAADHHLAHIAAHHHLPVTVGHGHRVVVGPVPHQGQGADTAHVLVAGIVWHGGERQQGLQVTLHPLAYRLLVPTQLSPQPLQAPLLQVDVERIEARERGHWHQEVPASISHQPLHLALVVALAWTAEPVLEQVVGLEFREHTSTLAPAVSQDPGHRQPRVVVDDAPGHPAQERERRDVTVAERLGRLRGVRLDEACVAVGKVQHEVVDGLLHSADDRLGLAEVALGITRRMGERNVHLACPETPLPHVVLDYRVLATEPVLRSQTVIDPLRRVALLPRKTPVLFQYPVDHPVVRVQLRATRR